MVCHSRAIVAASAGLAIILLFDQSCGRKIGSNGQTNAITPVYNKKTGRLELLKYDSDGDGKFDTFTYMDGPTLLRIEIDKDEDGKIERWEYYGPGKKLERIGLSRANNGVADTWEYIDAAGAVSRIEIAEHDGRGSGNVTKRIARTEYYERGALVRAEEDTDGDGVVDKWETYDGDRLAVVAFDEAHRGQPTRRLTYAPDGVVRVEVDPSGSGHFIEQSTNQATRHSQ